MTPFDLLPTPAVDAGSPRPPSTDRAPSGRDSGFERFLERTPERSAQPGNRDSSRPKPPAGIPERAAETRPAAVGAAPADASPPPARTGGDERIAEESTLQSFDTALLDASPLAGLGLTLPVAPLDAHAIASPGAVLPGQFDAQPPIAAPATALKDAASPVAILAGAATGSRLAAGGQTQEPALNAPPSPAATPAPDPDGALAGLEDIVSLIGRRQPAAEAPLHPSVANPVRGDGRPLGIAGMMAALGEAEGEAPRPELSSQPLGQSKAPPASSPVHGIPAGMAVPAPPTAPALAFAEHLKAEMPAGDGSDPVPSGSMTGGGNAATGSGAPAHGAMPASLAAHGTAAALAAQLGGEIARHASRGDTRFDIRLDPPELGRVQVRLDLSDDGALKAHLTVERPETLDLMMRDQRALERALREAGFDTRNGLSFSLSGDERQGHERAAQADHDANSHDDGASETIPEQSAVAHGAGGPGAGHLDIRI